MRQIAATHRGDKSHRLHCCCDKSLRQDTCFEHASEFGRGEMWTSFQIQHGWFKFCRSDLSHIRTHDAIRCDKAACAYFVAAICRTNSNQFEFVRQIAATKICRGDNDFHMSHDAICCSNLSRRRVAAICRIVCLGLNPVAHVDSSHIPQNLHSQHLSFQWKLLVKYTRRFETKLAHSRIFEVTQVTPQFFVTDRLA